MSWMIDARRAAKVVAVNLVLLTALLELAGVGVFFWREGRLFYLRGAGNGVTPVLGVEDPPAVEGSPDTQLHPVLGFTFRPGLPVTRVATRRRLDAMVGVDALPAWAALSANNFGFFSEHDYPYEPSDDAFLVGIFGGSVAQWLALQGGPVLSEKLRGLPGLDGRRVEVLNFAQASFKQPQQLQLLAYFLSCGQRLDYVINIDGFNEVALALRNVEREVHPSLPTSQKLLPLVALTEGTALDLEGIEALARARRSRARLAARERSSRRARLAGPWLVLELLRLRAARSHVAASLALEASPGGAATRAIHVNRWAAGEDPEEALDWISSLWLRSSALSSGLLREQGVPYLHVLQPNRHVSQKTLTAEERRLGASSPYAEDARRGYRRLLEELPALRAREVNVVSAVELFDATTETVYADNCCHFNQAGNEMLADFIGEQILKAGRALP